ncbi:uncharacterized protein LOC141679289 [Apium graveolens]|uniref:uncharacterized protein LOC141679287 n=1 Tax=Apium graveolens TaxID=4045 RepID=UPI003D7BF2A6
MSLFLVFKLLKRGCVMMHQILRRKMMGMMGIKLVVSFNSKGEPYGKVGAEMQSYIGVLARIKAPIWHDSWKSVPKDTQEKIWDCVQMAFIVPQSAKKMVLISASSKWREFKCRLTKDYILSYLDQPKILAHPPADYSFIEKCHWDIFISDRTWNKFMVIIYMSMHLESHPDIEEVDRSDTWIEARKDKYGNFLNDIVAEKAKEIVSY